MPRRSSLQDASLVRNNVAELLAKNSETPTSSYIEWVRINSTPRVRSGMKGWYSLLVSDAGSIRKEVAIRFFTELTELITGEGDAKVETVLKMIHSNWKHIPYKIPTLTTDIPNPMFSRKLSRRTSDFFDAPTTTTKRYEAAAIPKHIFYIFCLRILDSCIEEHERPLYDEFVCGSDFQDAILLSNPIDGTRVDRWLDDDHVDEVTQIIKQKGCIPRKLSQMTSSVNMRRQSTLQHGGRRKSRQVVRRKSKLNFSGNLNTSSTANVDIPISMQLPDGGIEITTNSIDELLEGLYNEFIVVAQRTSQQQQLSFLSSFDECRIRVHTEYCELLYRSQILEDYERENIHRSQELSHSNLQKSNNEFIRIYNQHQYIKMSSSPPKWWKPNIEKVIKKSYALKNTTPIHREKIHNSCSGALRDLLRSSCFPLDRRKKTQKSSLIKDAMKRGVGNRLLRRPIPCSVKRLELAVDNSTKMIPNQSDLLRSPTESFSNLNTTVSSLHWSISSNSSSAEDRILRLALMDSDVESGIQVSNRNRVLSSSRKPCSLQPPLLMSVQDICGMPYATTSPLWMR